MIGREEAYMNGKLSLKERIRACEDIAQEEVFIPEWKETLFVRSLTAAERDRYEEGILIGSGKLTKTNLKNARAKLAVLTCYDEEGNKVFTDEDVSWLSGKNAAALSRIFNVASRLSGITESDMEELEKNSENGQLDDLLSD
ncbi:MAG: hypothetical protein JEZ06_00490 [Anaerolineaceae bacterium]|nr:hypothetical protein [Anaerolineaceae bacterium]